jgi:intraflagellar transport protein 20
LPQHPVKPHGPCARRSLQECRVRILDLDKLNACKGLQDNSAAFASNMQQLQDSVSQYISTIDQQVRATVCAGASAHWVAASVRWTKLRALRCAQVERIETEKLKAVGLRNKVAAMHEVRGCALAT